MFLGLVPAKIYLGEKFRGYSGNYEIAVSKTLIDLFCPSSSVKEQKYTG